MLKNASIHVLFRFFKCKKNEIYSFFILFYILNTGSSVDPFFQFSRLNQFNQVYIYFSYFTATLERDNLKKVSNTVVNGSVYVCVVLWCALSV